MKRVIIEDYLSRNSHRHFSLAEAKLAGDLCQHLGTFAMLLEYDQVLTVSTTSSQGSLNLLAAPMQPHEKKIKALVEQKRVRYLIKDVELPNGVSISGRGARQRTAQVGSHN